MSNTTALSLATLVAMILMRNSNPGGLSSRRPIGPSHASRKYESCNGVGRDAEETVRSIRMEVGMAPRLVPLQATATGTEQTEIGSKQRGEIYYVCVGTPWGLWLALGV